jgi:hypothetical protein
LYDFQEIGISRQKSFPEFLICFFPIGGLAGFSSGNALAIPIANPPDLGASPPVNYTVVLSCSSRLLKKVRLASDSFPHALVLCCESIFSGGFCSAARPN